MVPHQWPVALAVIWHIYSYLACSSEDSAKDLPSSGKVVLGQEQIPCEFSGRSAKVQYSGEFEPRGWAAQLQIHEGGAQLAAADVIWHIYLHQCCFKGVLGMDLLSSGDVALTMWKVPCEFWADQQKLHFSAGGSRCDLAHLLTPVLLLEGRW